MTDLEVIDDIEALKDRNDILQSRVDELECILFKRHLLFPVEMKLTPLLEELLGLLISLPQISKDAAFIALYGDARRPSRPVLDVHISRLRRLLIPSGVVIRTIHGVGWAIDDEDREKLRRMVV